MSSEPTILPSRTIKLPFAWCGKKMCARPVTARGYRRPLRSVRSTSVMRAGRSWSFIVVSHEMKHDKDQVYDLDADERDQDPTEPIDQEMAAKQRPGADRTVLDPSQGQWNERDDNQGVKNHRGQDRALRCPHYAVAL